MDTKIIHKSLKKLMHYVESENFSGYDPYDALNSFINFKLLGRRGSFIASQIHKRNPFNIRKIIGIKKGYNPKGLGLFLWAYSILYQKEPLPNYKEKMDILFNHLCIIYSKDYSGYCWGYNFPYSSRINLLPAYLPSVVVTAFIASGIHEYYMATKNAKAKEILRSCCDFVLNDLHITENNNTICFSYTPIKKDLCYNATMLGSELLAVNYKLNREERLKSIAKKSVDFTISHQHQNGKWYYSIDEKGNEKKQIDFHQGFILNSLINYMEYTKDYDKKYYNAVKKGVEYYYKNQFLRNGQSIWRVPKKWPTDIHNQAQGILTFTKLGSLSPKYLQFAKKIASWTITYMQDKKGFFYYRKSRSFTNKIPYIRWGQAWMMLALVTLINSLEIKDKQRKL